MRRLDSVGAGEKASAFWRVEVNFMMDENRMEQ